MPNYCSNRLIITGNLENFRKTLFTKDDEGKLIKFSFSQTIPQPKNEEWYIWNNTNWGTKWDAMNVIIHKNTKEEVNITCETAWAPPSAWASNCVKKFPELTIEIAYCEVGAGFFGVDKINSTCKTKKVYQNMHKSGDFLFNESTQDFELKGDLKDFMEKWQIGLGG